MPRKKPITPVEQIPLKLTVAERTLVLEDLLCIDNKFEIAIRNTPSNQAVMMSVDDLDDFGGYIAAEANHCDDPRKSQKLDKIYRKIESLLGKALDQSPQTITIENQRATRADSIKAVQIAECAAKALIAAEQLGLKQQPIDHFWLSPAHREVLLLVPGVSKAIKSKLARHGNKFSVAEVAHMTIALADDFAEDDPRKQVAVLIVAKHLMDQMQDWIVGRATAQKSKDTKAKSATGTAYQFKITLLGTKPTIWRRIQVQDCTLDKLHEHIQTAMGWTNSHLHQFQIKGKRYGDPELLDDGFDGFECVDSTGTMVSHIVPKTGKRFAFAYEYDFGDGWEHEIHFEGSPPLDPRAKYPLCLEGERACPPEDCGGVWGYADFLEAIDNQEHELHQEMLEWVGGRFDADRFDAKRATKEMKKGLPDWRTM